MVPTQCCCRLFSFPVRARNHGMLHARLLKVVRLSSSPVNKVIAPTLRLSGESTTGGNGGGGAQRRRCLSTQRSRKNPWLHSSYNRERHSTRNRNTGMLFFVVSSMAGIVSVILMARAPLSRDKENGTTSTTTDQDIIANEAKRSQRQ